MEAAIEHCFYKVKTSSNFSKFWPLALFAYQVALYSIFIKNQKEMLVYIVYFYEWEFIVCNC